MCVLLQSCLGENNGGRNNIKIQDSTTINDACYDSDVYKSYRVGMSLEDLSTQQSAMISVVSGAMTGAFAVWLGSETKK